MKLEKMVSGFLICFLLTFTFACGDASTLADAGSAFADSSEKTEAPDNIETSVQQAEVQKTSDSSEENSEETLLSDTGGSISLEEIPSYDGTPFTVIHENLPFFTESDLTTEVFEIYSELDSLGRCGVAYANICQELMPTEERGRIGEVKPSGWHLVKYDGIDGNYLYNRCHLIGFQLAGENANEKNLITGTRYLNVEGMLPYENLVANYVEETDNHVLYRVTPLFDGDNLVASGVLMEGWSIEDDGNGICFNVYCYNVQPGIGIDYATGDSWKDAEGTAESDNNFSDAINGRVTDSSNTNETSSFSGAGNESVDSDTNAADGTADESDQEITYILNTNTKKFHYPNCSSVNQMKDKNKEEFTGTREEVIGMGYEPCKNCNP